MVTYDSQSVGIVAERHGVRQLNSPQLLLGKHGFCIKLDFCVFYGLMPEGASTSVYSVIPAQAGIKTAILDSCLRGNDGKREGLDVTGHLNSRQNSVCFLAFFLQIIPPQQSGGGKNQWIKPFKIPEFGKIKSDRRGLTDFVRLYLSDQPFCTPIAG